MPHPIKLKEGESLFTSAEVSKFNLAEPKYTALAYQVISAWSTTEATQLALFVMMLGGKESVAASIYLAQETRGAKNRSILAAADKVLSDRDYKLLLKLIEVGKPLVKFRDKLAHWQPAKIQPNQESKGLILMNLIESYKGQNYLFIFKEAELLRHISLISNLNVCYRWFVMMLMPEFRDGTIYEQICEKLDEQDTL